MQEKKTRSAIPNGPDPLCVCARLPENNGNSPTSHGGTRVGRVERNTEGTVI